VLWLPFVALVPLQLPLAVQLVALVVVHVRVDDDPLAILDGFDVKVTPGTAPGAAAATVAL
jgi:hypothetical protein